MEASILELPAVLPAFHVTSETTDLTVEDEWIWGAVAAAIVLFGGVAAACRAICWGKGVKKCKTTWYGMLDVQCR